MNNVLLNAKIQSVEPSFFIVDGEKYRVVTLIADRLSGKFDIIKMLVSEKVEKFTQDDVGRKIKAIGEYISINKRENNRRKLLLFLKAFYVEIVEDCEDKNYIAINCYVCKKPVYRITPRGRVICDLLVASNRDNGKSDYLPCIAWGSSALDASNLNVGDNIYVVGRLQSREYVKNDEVKTAFEISIDKFQKTC